MTRLVCYVMIYKNYIINIKDATTVAEAPRYFVFAFIMLCLFIAEIIFYDYFLRKRNQWFMIRFAYRLTLAFHHPMIILRHIKTISWKKSKIYYHSRWNVFLIFLFWRWVYITSCPFRKKAMVAFHTSVFFIVIEFLQKDTGASYH